ncbi:EamA family transporter [Georgenia sp. H159]|uniref:EamA family transporter n=1 Tax=Georgenia sp. H159 TaxID=3076115 RepID=UPI002D7A18FF|nr:EamA family transporter [Georgenia sp. H159]
MTSPSGARLRTMAVSLVLAAAVSTQFGAAVGALVFPQAGPMGVVTLRLVFGAAILLALLRPRVRGRTASDWLLVLGLGLSLALMNTMLYHAIDRIPLGIGVTFEVLGPLVLYVVLGRRSSHVVWAVLALAGVYLLGGDLGADLDPVGVALALGAGAAWAGYILVGSRVARRFDGADGLALALAVGAVLALPLGVATAGTALVEPGVLGVGALVAVLSSVVPYSLEMAALRRVTAGSFAVLMSLYPLIAALAGRLVLGQALGGLELVGILLVAVATAGATRHSAPVPG